MTKFIKHSLIFWYYFIPASWYEIHGRCFVWRNTPYYFVRYVAMQKYRNPTEYNHPDLKWLVDMAIHECKLRKTFLFKA